MSFKIGQKDPQAQDQNNCGHFLLSKVAWQIIHSTVSLLNRNPCVLTAYYAALTPKSKIAASELQNGQLTGSGKRQDIIATTECDVAARAKSAFVWSVIVLNMDLVIETTRHYHSLKRSYYKTFKEIHKILQKLHFYIFDFSSQGTKCCLPNLNDLESVSW